MGEECHIVAQKDSVSVSRSPSSLSEDEKRKYAALISDRHSLDNLILLCVNHSTMVDNPAESYTVAELIRWREEHEDRVAEALEPLELTPLESSARPSQGGSPRLIILEDVPFWERKAIRRLAENERDALHWLLEQVGEPAEPDKVEALIALWPKRLAEGSFDLLHAVARQAERAGRWSPAATVWERMGERETAAATKADRYVVAAIDARMVDEDERYDRLMRLAEEADPASPRLRLERLDECALERSPTELLRALDDIETDDAPLAALIAAQKARASLLIPNIELAESYLQEAEELDLASVGVRMMSVNIRVQKARIALHEDREISVADALTARDDALALRDELIEMGRWDESGRLLMLAADVPALMRDFPSSLEILRKACPEELGTPERAAVLSEAALRNTAPDLALSMSDGVEETDAIKRIRASATIDQANRPVPTSLSTLRELALGGGEEAEAAAFARLVACLPPVKAEWDEEVAALISEGHERLVDSLRLMRMAAGGNLIAAEEAAEALPDEIWAAEIKLRLALERGAQSRMRETAEAFLSFGPNAPGRLLAAKALRRAGALDRAGQTFANVAHDENVAPVVRSEAYAELIQTLALGEEWERAKVEWEGWQRFANNHLPRPDGRLSEWQVRIVHHTRRDE